MWKSVDEQPPEQGEIVELAAWEYGCPIMLFFAHMWKSSLDGQPMQWYMAPEFYPLDRPRIIAYKARYWRSLDIDVLQDFANTQPELFKKEG